jgi:hypothetical protein
MSEKLSSIGVTNGAEADFSREIREVFLKQRDAARNARDPADFDLCDMLHIMASEPPAAENNERAQNSRTAVLHSLQAARRARYMDVPSVTVRRRLAGPS